MRVKRGDTGGAAVVVRAAGGSPRLGAVALRAMVARSWAMVVRWFVVMSKKVTTSCNL